MRTTWLVFILVTIPFCGLKAQQDTNNTVKKLPSSIYFVASENNYSEFYADLRTQVGSLQFKFLRFDTDRIHSNLSNALYFDAFTTKPSRYYLDTYKKLYDLKGQQATFFKLEQLYEVPAQSRRPYRNK